MIDVELHGDCMLIALNDPATRNALSLPMIEKLIATLDQAARESRAVVLIGGSGSFCTGAALNDGIDPSQPGYDAGYSLETHFNELMLALRDLPVPVIAALSGAVVGGGISLALLCDYIIASQDCFFAAGFGRLGLVPDSGAMQLMANAIGRPRTMEFMLLDDRLTADQALSWGLINQVSAPFELLPEALSLGRKLSQGPTVALGLMRQLSWRSSETAYADVLAIEREMQRVAGNTSDHRIGMAAFISRKPPKFIGE